MGQRKEEVMDRKEGEAVEGRGKRCKNKLEF